MRRTALLFGLLLGSANVAWADAPTGTWAGGTNATGRWTYTEVHVTSEARATIDVPTAQVAGLPLDDLRLDGSHLTFRVSTALGLMSFDGTMENGVVDGALAGGAAGARLHLIRIASPEPAQAYAAVGEYQLDHQEAMVVTYRPFGELMVMILDRSTPIEKLKRALFAIPVDQDRYVTSGSIIEELKRDEILTLQRESDGSVKRIVWALPGGKTRTAKRDVAQKQIRVSFPGKAGTIAGTLFLPATKSPTAAAVLVGGSGPTTRDNIVVRARDLSRLGIAALAYDKRGVGETDGHYMTATFDDLADDAASALAYLQSRGDLDPKSIGIEGHSQGGWIAPLAATRAVKPPTWLVISSGGPTPPAEQEAWRAATQSRGAGATEEESRAAEAFMRRKWRYAFTGEDWPGYVSAARQAASAKWGTVVSPILAPDSTSWAFMRALRDFDPMTSAASLRMPLLVLFGDRDDEQPVTISRAHWEEAFQRSGNADHQFVTIEQGTHSLWVGAGDERPLRPEPTEAIRKWLEAHGYWTNPWIPSSASK